MAGGNVVDLSAVGEFTCPGPKATTITTAISAAAAPVAKMRTRAPTGVSTSTSAAVGASSDG
jgi:hypothetical protein